VNVLRNKIFKFILVSSIIANINHPCLADHTESSRDRWPGPGTDFAGDMAPQINTSIQKSKELSDDVKQQVEAVYKGGANILRGTVPQDSDKEKINAIVDRVGATNIRNEIKVVPSTDSSSNASNQSNKVFTEKRWPGPGSDFVGNMAPQVNYAIQNAKDLSEEVRQSVTASYKGGAVILQGMVPQESDKEKINSIVGRLGAVNIRNEVKVQEAPKKNYTEAETVNYKYDKH
jgi:osmotically-inducible protein OsmY